MTGGCVPLALVYYALGGLALAPVLVTGLWALLRGVGNLRRYRYTLTRLERDRPDPAASPGDWKGAAFVLAGFVCLLGIAVIALVSRGL